MGTPRFWQTEPGEKETIAEVGAKGEKDLSTDTGFFPLVLSFMKWALSVRFEVPTAMVGIL
jgi:hypothetical protein